MNINSKIIEGFYSGKYDQMTIKEFREIINSHDFQLTIDESSTFIPWAVSDFIEKSRNIVQKTRIISRNRSTNE